MNSVTIKHQKRHFGEAGVPRKKIILNIYRYISYLFNHSTANCSKRPAKLFFVSYSDEVLTLGTPVLYSNLSTFCNHLFYPHFHNTFEKVFNKYSCLGIKFSNESFNFVEIVNI